MWIVGRIVISLKKARALQMNLRFYGAFRTVNSIERSQENRWVNCYLDAIMGKFSIKIMCQIKKLFRLPSLQAISLRGYSGYQVVNIWALKKKARQKVERSQKELHRWKWDDFLWVCPFWAEGVSSQTHKKGMIFKSNAQESVKKFYFFELWPHQREY